MSPFLGSAVPEPPSAGFIYSILTLPAMAEKHPISVEYRGRVAVITIDNDKKLNSLTQKQYYDLGQLMREVATHDEVYITVLIGKGRYFSA